MHTNESCLNQKKNGAQNIYDTCNVQYALENVRSRLCSHTHTHTRPQLCEDRSIYFIRLPGKNGTKMHRVQCTPINFVGFFKKLNTE